MFYVGLNLFVSKSPNIERNVQDISVLLFCVRNVVVYLL